MVIAEVTLLPQSKPARYRDKPYLRQADGDYVMNPNDLRILALSALTVQDAHNFDFNIISGSDTDLLDKAFSILLSKPFAVLVPGWLTSKT